MNNFMRKGVAFGLAGLISFSAWASKSNDIRAKIAEKLGDKNELVLKLKKRDKRTDIKLAQVLKYLPKQMRVGGHVVEFKLPENNGEDKNGNNDEDDNTPESDNDDNHDAPQYDNFPDSASVAINEQENKPENDPKEDPESGDDGNGGKISKNPNSSTQAETVDGNPDSTEKATMFAFLKDYPANGSDNYKSFINRLNEKIKRFTNEEFKNQMSMVQGDINFRYTAPGVTDTERAKLKKIAKKLNEVYGWNLRMPKEPGTPNYNATMSHKELLKNEAYKMSYEYLQKHFGVQVSSNCDKVAGTRAFTPKEQQVYLLTTYESYTAAPHLFTTQSKKSFLGLYYHKSYAQTPKDTITIEFAARMRKAKQFLLTGNVASHSLSQTLKNIADLAAKIRAEEAKKQKEKIKVKEFSLD